MLERIPITERSKCIPGQAHVAPWDMGVRIRGCIHTYMYCKDSCTDKHYESRQLALRCAFGHKIIERLQGHTGLHTQTLTSSCRARPGLVKLNQLGPLPSPSPDSSTYSTCISSTRSSMESSVGKACMTDTFEA